MNVTIVKSIIQIIIMDINEFYQLKRKLDEENLNCLECGDPNSLGLVLDYRIIKGRGNNSV